MHSAVNKMMNKNKIFPVMWQIDAGVYKTKIHNSAWWWILILTLQLIGVWERRLGQKLIDLLNDPVSTLKFNFGLFSWLLYPCLSGGAVRA